MDEKKIALALDQVTLTIDTAIAHIKNSATVSVYDADGKRIFLGTPRQLSIACAGSL